MNNMNIMNIMNIMNNLEEYQNISLAVRNKEKQKVHEYINTEDYKKYVFIQRKRMSFRRKEYIEISSRPNINIQWYTYIDPQYIDPQYISN